MNAIHQRALKIIILSSRTLPLLIKTLSSDYSPNVLGVSFICGFRSVLWITLLASRKILSRNENGYSICFRSYDIKWDVNWHDWYFFFVGGRSNYSSLKVFVIKESSLLAHFHENSTDYTLWIIKFLLFFVSFRSLSGSNEFKNFRKKKIIL